MILNYKNPIYLEIVEEYKKYIDMGIYQYNDRLPTVRALAEELGINPNTVQRAYKILEDEGYVKVLSTKGVCVNKQISQDAKKNTRDDVKKMVVDIKNKKITKEDLLVIIEEVYNN